MRYVKVRVVNSDGRTVHYAKVVVWVYQTLASGAVEKYTDSEGLAQFEMDIDDCAEIEISVNGERRVQKGPVLSEFTLTA